MKRKLYLLIMLEMFCTVGCANNISTRADLNKTNAVQDVVNQQIAKEKAVTESSQDMENGSLAVSERNLDGGESSLEVFETTLDPVSEAMESIQSSRIDEQNRFEEEQMALMKSTDGVDFDLTKMNSDMVYAMVYQLMTEPDQYEGKVFRISGSYYGSLYDKTNQFFHYCIIQDALGCCTQGMEFIWGDGSRVYPDEYPNEGAEVEVTGTFETYSENNDERLYCRLNHCTMTVKSINSGG